VSIEIITPSCIRIVMGFVSLQEISDWLMTHRIMGAGDILNEENETCGSWVHSNGLPSVLLEED
jgi:hypothetical protein